MKNYILLFIIIFITLPALAQQGIKGIIKNEKNEPIEAVIGYQKLDTIIGVENEKNGQFFIQLAPNTYTIKVFSFGYKTQIINNVKINAKQITQINFVLQALTSKEKEEQTKTELEWEKTGLGDDITSTVTDDPKNKVWTTALKGWKIKPNTVNNSELKPTLITPTDAGKIEETTSGTYGDADAPMRTSTSAAIKYTTITLPPPPPSSKPIAEPAARHTLSAPMPTAYADKPKPTPRKNSVKTEAAPVMPPKILYEEEVIEETVFSGKEGIGNPANIKPGTLTAGEVNDFSKWEMWQDIAAEQLLEWQSFWKYNPKQRYVIQLITNDGTPLIDQKVTLVNPKKQTVFTAKTDNTGKAELWAKLFSDANEKEAYSIYTVFENREYSIEKAKTFHKGINKLQINTTCNTYNNVDIAFVIDATGSMGDEINYLKREVEDVIQQSKKKNKDLKIKLASVFYKDNGEDYLTQYIPFYEQLDSTVRFIQKQKYGGGGDTPEAVDAALDVALNTLQWSTTARTRIMFLMLDAPPHEDTATIEKVHRLALLAAEKGIRIIPITCSGVDKSTEYLMRCLALTTNGTYTFLTDDSRIGNPHIKPTTDEYKVETLNNLMVRVIQQFTETPTCDNKPIEQPENKQVTIVLNPKSETGQDTQPLKINKFTCYPNPTTGIINIEIKGEIKELFIADANGKILERIEVNNNKLKFDLSNYPAGIYFVQHPNGDKWQAAKIILVH